MAHVLSMFDSEYLHSYDLSKSEVTVEIESVSAGQLPTIGGRKPKKPVVKFKGAEKGLALNKTNAKTMIGLYGAETDAWTGKKVTLYKTITTFGAEEVEGIRIRPPVPK